MYAGDSQLGINGQDHSIDPAIRRAGTVRSTASRRLAFPAGLGKSRQPGCRLCVESAGCRSEKDRALMGISFGGELAPRAAAFDKRIAALVANDGVYDYGAANLTHVLAELRAAFLHIADVDSKRSAASRSDDPSFDGGVSHGGLGHHARHVCDGSSDSESLFGGGTGLQFCATASPKPSPVRLLFAKPKATCFSGGSLRSFLPPHLPKDLHAFR